MGNFTKIIEECRYDGINRVDKYTHAIEQTIKWVPATWASYPQNENGEVLYGEHTISRNGRLANWRLMSGNDLINAILGEEYGCEAVVYICDRDANIEHAATDSEILSLLKWAKDDGGPFWVHEGDPIEETSYGEWTGHSFYDLTIYKCNDFFWLEGALTGPSMNETDKYEERVEED